jgi:serine/threonine protein kinase
VTTPTDPLAELRAALPAAYILDGHLGSGGQGSVFRGRINGTLAAVKVYSATSDPRRIERELSALRAIDCPHLVKVLDTLSVDIGGNRHEVVAYEFLDGHDLTTMAQPGPSRPDLATLKNVGEHVSIAIEHLWLKRIVHRDIKPANIMQTAGRNVLVDIGFAKHLDRSMLTVGGNPGTRGFMSPEQSGGRRNLTNRSDAYSLGLTLYLLAAGQHPFGLDQARIGRVPFAGLATHRSDLPAEFCGLVDAMLHPVAHLRPGHLSRRFAQF